MTTGRAGPSAPGAALASVHVKDDTQTNVRRIPNGVDTARGARPKSRGASNGAIRCAHRHPTEFVFRCGADHDR